MRTTEKVPGAKKEFHAFPRTLTIGTDLGDRFGHYCILDQKGAVVEEGRVNMTQKEVTAHFQRVAAARIAMEAGTHSGWVCRLLESFGHEVLIANVCETPGISQTAVPSGTSSSPLFDKVIATNPSTPTKNNAFQYFIAFLIIPSRILIPLGPQLF